MNRASIVYNDIYPVTVDGTRRNSIQIFSMAPQPFLISHTVPGRDITRESVGKQPDFRQPAACTHMLEIFKAGDGVNRECLDIQDVAESNVGFGFIQGWRPPDTNHTVTLRQIGIYNSALSL
jgi:hypothetical protein